MLYQLQIGMHYYYDMRRGLYIFLIFSLLTTGSYFDYYMGWKKFMKNMNFKNMFLLCTSEKYTPRTCLISVSWNQSEIWCFDFILLHYRLIGSRLFWCTLSNINIGYMEHNKKWRVSIWKSKMDSKNKRTS